MKFIGKIKGIDRYGKLNVIIFDNETIERVINEINENYNTPYLKTDNGTILFIKINKYIDYYRILINNNIQNFAEIEVNIKRYNFDEKKGSSLYLHSLTII